MALFGRGGTPDPTPEQAAQRERTRGANAREADNAWGALSLIISGVALYGGVGALVGWWLDSKVPVGVGLMAGMAGALYLVWVRYGRA